MYVFPVDKMVRVRVVGDMKCDDIRGGKKFWECGIGEAERCGEIIIFHCIKPENLHIKTVRHANDVGADAPTTDNTNRFAGQVKATQIVVGECARRAHTLVSVNEPSRECEQECEGKLGDRVFSIRR